jgi:hypothetical protein
MLHSRWRMLKGPPSARSSIAQTDHPAIGYSSRPTSDPVARFNARIEGGAALLKFDEKTGYLRSVLDGLNVPVDSQGVVFSKTSVQAPRISPQNPRAIFFNDEIVVGYIRNAPFLELAVQDPQQGVIFYVLDQREAQRPRLSRTDSCLICHLSRNSMDVPGMLLRSIVTDRTGRIYPQLGNYLSDHRSPMEERWGGWYVTGQAGKARHLGNAFLTDADKPESMVTPATLAVKSLEGYFDLSGYLSPGSDVVALMVFEHQMHMMNLLTRLGWDARAALHQDQSSPTAREVTDRVIQNDVREVVDYLLFVDEAPLSGRVAGASGFAERFPGQGPKDSKGRSLRQLDLNRRLMRYPCSYMIYSPAFEGLPEPVKSAVYRRLWQILSGAERDSKYAKLSREDRRAIVEILRETKKDLPPDFS